MKLILSLHLYVNILEPAKKKKKENRLKNLLFWGFLFPGVYLDCAPQAI